FSSRRRHTSCSRDWSSDVCSSDLEAVRLAVEALRERSAEKAERAIALDDEIDAMELAIDDHAIHLLALQQPLAKDLRFITMAMQIANDLERVGDHAVNIAQDVGHLIAAPIFPRSE